ncbi:A24 family peptidase [Streptomyces platensis]|nr:A24 family peptidase [Streptomyces platensis]
MHLALISLGAAFGGAAGLFIPRPAYRLAVRAGETWRTHCPQGHAITGMAAGWVGLPCCAGNRQPMAGVGAWNRSCRYGRGRVVAPAVAALVCALLPAVVGMRPELLLWMLLTPIAVLLGLVDAAAHRLPDMLTLPAAGLTVALLGAAALLPGHQGSWIASVEASLVLGVIYFAMFLINPSGMGFGDVKLALTVGALLGWYGWPILFLGTLVTFACGALFAIGLLITRRATRRSAMAFGPFMLIGALAGVLFGAWTA